MLNNNKKKANNESILYNNILLLARNKLFYTKFNLLDTFQNRIHLIFLHVSFLFIKINQDKKNKVYKEFHQRFFDLIFYNIEQNMREIGYGDVIINKNMKSLVRIFYDILLNCENFKRKSFGDKNVFLSRYLDVNEYQNKVNNELLISYFDKYQAFCFDLNSDSVLKGNLKFNYK